MINMKVSVQPDLLREHAREKLMLEHQIALLQGQLEEVAAREQQCSSFYSSVLATVQSLKAAPCPRCQAREQDGPAKEAGREKQGELQAVRGQLAASIKEHR
jgi:hypothetical protein